MAEIREYISALRKCAKEHEKDKLYTGQINTSDLCNDTARLLENDVVERSKIDKAIKEIEQKKGFLLTTSPNRVSNAFDEALDTSLKNSQSKYRRVIMITKEQYESTLTKIFDLLRQGDSDYYGTPQCSGVPCSNCPFKYMCETTGVASAFEAVEFVQKWRDEHPIVTNQDKFVETFPDFGFDMRLLTQCNRTLCKHYQETHNCEGCNGKKVEDWFRQEYKGDK